MNMISMSKVSSDYWLIRDDSPDKWNIWSDWLSEIADWADKFTVTMQQAPQYLVNDQTFSKLQQHLPKPDMQQFYTVFDDEIRPANDLPGTDTHDDRGRPLLDASGGPVRPMRMCPRHGKPMLHGRCPLCT